MRNNLAVLRFGVENYQLTLAVAVAKTLGFETVKDLAEGISRERQEVSQCLNGYPHRIYPDIRERLAVMLGVDASELGALIEWAKERA